MSIKHELKKRWALYSPMIIGFAMVAAIFIATNPEIAEAGRHN